MFPCTLCLNDLLLPTHIYAGKYNTWSHGYDNDVSTLNRGSLILNYTENHWTLIEILLFIIDLEGNGKYCFDGLIDLITGRTSSF